MARLGGLDEEILVEGAHNAVCKACRVLMSRGILGPLETWKVGISYPCMTGDIEKVAGLTICEPDDFHCPMIAGFPCLSGITPSADDLSECSRTPSPGQPANGCEKALRNRPRIGVRILHRLG